MLIADEETAAYIGPVDYFVITDVYRGGIVADAQRLKADTVLLTRHLNAKVRRRYARELEGAGLPYRDISRTGWRYVHR